MTSAVLEGLSDSYHNWYRISLELFEARNQAVERQKFEEEYSDSFWSPKIISFLTEGLQANPLYDPDNPLLGKWSYPFVNCFKEPLIKQCNALSRLSSALSATSSGSDFSSNTQSRARKVHIKGYELEREVATIYRALGAQVEHNVSLAGNQIDILIAEQTSSGSTVRSAIECKAYTRPVGIDIISSFSAISRLLKDRALIDRAILVSTNGFTAQARSAAKEHSVDLLELGDLQQRVRGHAEEVKQAEIQVEHEQREATTQQHSKSIFVVMPFSKEFDDAYTLGIREVAEKLGFVVERADSIEHNGQILEVIQEKIRACDVVVADATFQNPNVFYEIGYSHAFQKPTVLISRADESVPFDLRTINHIFYETIVELRQKLERHLTHMFDDNNS